MSCNIDCGAIPIKVPPADAFIPYVNRAEIAAEEAEENAQQAKEAVESITDISNQVKQVQQLAQQAKESEVNANASAQIATNKANEVSENAQIASTKANEAVASANIATDKASEASASAASAKTSENKANEYAKEAKESVDSIDTSNLAKLIDNNTFNGINTFNNTINVPTPVDDSNAVNKNYVDNANVSSANKIGAGYNFDSSPTPNNEQFRENVLKFTEENKTSVRPFVGKSFCGGDGTHWNGLAFATDGYINFIQTHPTNKKFYYGGLSGNDRYCIQLANINSPSLTGTPTAPTASAETNTDQLATCAFVKAQSASMQVSTLNINNKNNNYWTKDPSGIVHQFAKVDATTEEITIPFPISFPSKCLCVMIEILNPDKDISKNVSFNIIEKNVDGIKLLKIGNGNPTITVTAIGA